MQVTFASTSQVSLETNRQVGKNDVLTELSRQPAGHLEATSRGHPPEWSSFKSRMPQV
jgi:hypothetical protein